MHRRAGSRLCTAQGAAGATSSNRRASRCRPAAYALPRNSSSSGSSSSNFSSKRRMLSYSAPAGSTATSPSPTTATAKGQNRRGRVALGAVATVVAAAALVREAHLPDKLSEWDDQLQWEEVHQLAQLSNMTHKDPQLVARWFDCHQYTGSLVDRHLPQVSNHYFVHVGHLPGEEHRRVHHVAIRGTVSFADLSIDLKTRQVFDEECGCVFHAGFKEVADAVVEDLEGFLEPGTEVKLAGHSLGGAAAVIVAAKLKLRGHNVGKVMTFGAPMVTDAAGAAKLRNLLPVMRVTHERDPVPLTPLESGSRTSAVAAKLLSKSAGAGAGGSLSRAQEKEEERAEEEAWEASDSSRTGSTAGASAEVAKEEENGAKRAGEGRNAAAASTGNGGWGEGGTGGKEGGERWRVESSPVYAHFGSQVVLLRRKRCIECYREEIAATTGTTLRRLRSSAVSLLTPLWERLNGEAEGNGQGQAKKCEHCPSRGTTYYDPKGEDGCLFDSPWLRLSHPNFTHRMNHYEDEIAERLEHHRMRGGDPMQAREKAPSNPPVEERSDGGDAGDAGDAGGGGDSSLAWASVTEIGTPVETGSRSSA